VAEAEEKALTKGEDPAGPMIPLFLSLQDTKSIQMLQSFS
jgi:hypothetical protein